MTSGKRAGAEILRHFFLADIISLKTMARAVLRLRQPLVFRVRLRTVAREIALTLAVLAIPSTSLHIFPTASKQIILRHYRCASDTEPVAYERDTSSQAWPNHSNAFRVIAFRPTQMAGVPVDHFA